MPRLARHVTVPAPHAPGNCHPAGGARGASPCRPLAARRSARGSVAASAPAIQTAWASAPRSSREVRGGGPHGGCGRTYSTRIPARVRARSGGRPGGRARAPAPGNLGRFAGRPALEAPLGPGRGCASGRSGTRRGCAQAACGPALLRSAGTWELRRAEEQLCLGFPACKTTRWGRWVSAVPPALRFATVSECNPGGRSRWDGKSPHLGMQERGSAPASVKRLLYFVQIASL